jgi:quinolinate synthase
MLVATTIADEILDLKRQRRAILLAHHYQESEIQELADVIGDSLELARKARDFSGDVIAFCGVWFMAETAKVLNPERIVVVPDREASCSLVEGCPVEPIREFRRQHPTTRSSAISIRRSRSRRRAIFSAPRAMRSRWSIRFRASSPSCSCRMPISATGVRKQTGRENMKIWQGACIVHATFPARRLAAARLEHPDAEIVAHPECPEAVLAMADFIGSTSALIDYCAKSDAREFIVMTESGVNHSLTRLAPDKQFYYVANEKLQLQ